MHVRLFVAVLAASYHPGTGSLATENCNEEVRSGPFKISIVLNRRVTPFINIQYRVPKEHMRPKQEKLGTDSPTISLGFKAPLGGDGAYFINFYSFEKLFQKNLFPVRSMTFLCGRTMKLSGDTLHQKYLLGGRFIKDSPFQNRECIEGLVRDGYYKISFEEQEGEKRVATVEGRADFADAITRSERMARHRLAMAKAGECVLNPPPPPVP